MEIIFMSSSLTEEAEIKRMLQARSPCYVDVETRFKHIRLVFIDWLSTIYVITKELLEQRISLPDVMLNFGCNIPEPVLIRESRLCKYRLLDGTTLLTFGNLFAWNAILLGPRFADFKSSPQFAQMVNRNLKNLVLDTRAYQMNVVSWE